MKHACLVPTLLGAVFAGPLAAQTITVTNPNANTVWTVGNPATIQWTKQGSLPATVRILLIDEAEATIVQVIKDPAPNTGTYQWPAVQGSFTLPKYKVKVRASNTQIAGTSAAFLIKAQSGPLVAAGLHGMTAQIPIRVLEPTKDSVWTIGEIHTVRWQAVDSVKYPVWVFLVSADHHIPIVDIGKVGSEGYRPSEKNWTVTDNLYDGQYCVRITSADRKDEVHSASFQIKASKILKFNVAPPSVANKVHWHNWMVKGTSFGGEFIGAPLTAVPDPGGSAIKYGYQRWYEDGDNHGYILHRSFVKFDLAGVIAQLKHKVTVKSAYIDWVKAPNSPQACAPVIFCLDAEMPNLNEGMFGPTFTGFPKHPLTGDQPTQVQMAQRWLDDPTKNYGLVVIAQNEGQPTENGQCVMFATNVVMKLELEEKLNK
jgi:hypothetical protein